MKKTTLLKRGVAWSQKAEMARKQRGGPKSRLKQNISHESKVLFNHFLRDTQPYVEMKSLSSRIRSLKF